MIHREHYWAGHHDEKHAAIALAELVTNHASTGAEYAACARFLAGAGLVDEAGWTLWTRIMRRIEALREAGTSQDALAEAAHLGEAMRLLSS